MGKETRGADSTIRQHTRIRVEEPFSLWLALSGHGWISLPPNDWDADAELFRTAIQVEGSAVEVRAGQSGEVLRVAVLSRRRLTRNELARLRAVLARMLRLDEDLEPFWRLCRKVPRLRWVARRGAGRMLRSPTLFEDLMKLLFTTNCSWAATRGMTRNLIEALGEPTPTGRRCFPSAERCADQGESFYREVVRAGYRASFCHRLAVGFADGSLNEEAFADHELPTDELRRRLLAIPGMGPYAAGQALRLLGRHEDLALDSWCRAELARLKGRKKPPSDKAIEREYRWLGPYKGLGLWMDLTARWHGEGPLAKNETQ